MGIPSGENTRSSFGITTRVLVLITSSTSALRECLHNYDDPEVYGHLLPGFTQ